MKKIVWGLPVIKKIRRVPTNIKDSRPPPELGDLENSTIGGIGK
jgi:hypothetical protein